MPDYRFAGITENDWVLIANAAGWKNAIYRPVVIKKPRQCDMTDIVHPEGSTMYTTEMGHGASAKYFSKAVIDRARFLWERADPKPHFGVKLENKL